MNCPICNYGIKQRKVIFLPVKENNIISCYMRLTENGELHKQILKQTGGELPKQIILL